MALHSLRFRGSRKPIRELEEMAGDGFGRPLPSGGTALTAFPGGAHFSSFQRKLGSCYNQMAFPLVSTVTVVTMLRQGGDVACSGHSLYWWRVTRDPQGRRPLHSKSAECGQVQLIKNVVEMPPGFCLQVVKFMGFPVSSRESSPATGAPLSDVAPSSFVPPRTGIPC